MSKKRIQLVSFIFILMLLPLAGYAQEAKNPKTNSLLPEINPQDIEIKGDFKATFPGLRRQPILGFDPTPPVFQVNGNNIPFMESPDEAVANLPISKLEKPIAPPMTYFTYPHVSQLYSHLGWGTDMSPEAGFYGEYKTGHEGSFLGHFNFQSSNGHYTYQKDSYRNMGLDFAYIQKIKKDSRFGIGLNGFSDFNYRPGIDTAMDYGAVGIQIGYDKIKNPYNEFRTHFDYHYFSYYPQGTTPKNLEHLFDLIINKSWEGGPMNSKFVVGVDAKASIFNTQNLSGKDWYIVKPGFGYVWRVGYSHRISLKLNGYFVGDTASSKVYLYPDLKYEFWGIPNLKFTAEVLGKVFNNGMQGWYKQDQMLVRNMVSLNERDLTARAQADYQFAKGAKFTAGFRYQKYYDFQYMNLDSLGTYSMSTDNNTQVWRGFVGLSYDFIPQKIAFNAQVYYQNQKLSNNLNVPFVPKAGAKAELEFHPVHQLYFKAWGNFLGKRTYANGKSLKDALLLGGRIEYDFTPVIGIYIKGTNLLNRPYMLWPSYHEMPFQLFGGITFRR